MSSARNLTLLPWFNFFSAFKLYSAIAIIYFSDITNSYTLGLSIFSVMQVSNALFEIPTGIFSDRLGRKYTLLLGSVVSLVSLIFYAWGQSYAVLIVGAVLEGMSLAFFSGNNDALLYDTVSELGEKNRYHEHLGKTRSMLYPSLAVAALLGGVLASVSFPLVFWLSLIPKSVCLILALQIVEPARQVLNGESSAQNLRDSMQVLLRNIQLRRLSISEVLKLSVEELLFQTQLLFYNTLWPVWAVGLTRSIMALGKFISFRFSGKIINRFTAIKTLIISDITTRVVHVLAIVFSSVLSPVLMASTGLLWGVSSVSKSKLLQEQFPSKQRATMSSIISFLGNLLAGAVAVGIGIFSDTIGLVQTLLVMQLFFVPIIFLYVRFSRDSRDEG